MIGSCLFELGIVICDVSKECYSSALISDVLGGLNDDLDAQEVQNEHGLYTRQASLSNDYPQPS